MLTAEQRRITKEWKEESERETGVPFSFGAVIADYDMIGMITGRVWKVADAKGGDFFSESALTGALPGEGDGGMDPVIRCRTEQAAINKLRTIWRKAGRPKQ